MRYIVWTCAFLIVGTCVSTWPRFPHLFAKRLEVVESINEALVEPINEPLVKPLIKVVDDDIFYRLFFLFIA